VRCLARQLQVTPLPLDVTDYHDAFGNPCTRLSCGPDRVDALVIDSRLEVETNVPQRDARQSVPALPWLPSTQDGLAAFRDRDESPLVASFAQTLAKHVDYAPLAFFEALCSDLYTNTNRQLRLEGAAQTATETLESRRGACRDLTVLFLAVCRAHGVAARFVSGYLESANSIVGRGSTHAWAEIYLPEWGWTGWDPSTGKRVDSGHIAVGVSQHPRGVMPVTGGFTGLSGIGSSLYVSITTRRLPPLAQMVPEVTELPPSLTATPQGVP
jgi:transglutaminase-like putative cysteine protease